MCLFLGCKSADTPFKYQPYENLLAAVSDLELYFDADIYRFPIPKDISGQNIFRANIVRLSNFKKINPGEFVEEIALTQARCWMMLSEYELSSDNYVECLNQKGKLAALARAEWDKLESFREVLKTSDATDTADEAVKQKKEVVKRLKDFALQNKGTRYETLALIEAENQQINLIEALKSSSELFKNPIARISDEYEVLINDNRESKRYFEHIMSFGDFWRSLAEDYARLHSPEQGNFDIELFRNYVLKATEQLSLVSEADGAPERPVADKKLDGMIQFSRMTEDKAK